MGARDYIRRSRAASRVAREVDLDEMRGTWMVQRMSRPHRHDIPEELPEITFGAGVKDGDLAPELADLRRPYISWDYMGASEFEGGSIREALQKIARLGAHYT